MKFFAVIELFAAAWRASVSKITYFKPKTKFEDLQGTCHMYFMVWECMRKDSLDGFNNRSKNAFKSGLTCIRSDCSLVTLFSQCSWKFRSARTISGTRAENSGCRSCSTDVQPALTNFLARGALCHSTSN